MTRGFAVLSELCTRVPGEPVELLAAIGHGRSFGMPSSVLGRGLPGILQCGLWRALDARPAPVTRAVVGDVGNDLLYGAPVDTILAWVDECLRRLRAAGAEVVLTSLPPHVRTLSRARFLAFRTLFFPARHLTYEGMRPAVAALDDGLQKLAQAHGVALAPLRPEWYGFDPIHIRPWHCRRAWGEILAFGGPPLCCPRVGIVRSLATYRLFPERQWLFGREMQRPQPCRRLADGTSFSFY
ncbi:MAG TPA: hypothetical protein VFX50_18520 [Gemmatimonadales bacterium]|nr:hypothetical protein [Gemmatimonadales bacterium]